MVGEHGSRLRRGRPVRLFRVGEQGVADEIQVLDVLVEVTQAGGQFVDLTTHLLGLSGQRLLAGVDPLQQPCSGIGVPADVSRQVGVEGPVSRRAITSVIAPYTRDSELAGWCSWSRTMRRCRDIVP